MSDEKKFQLSNHKLGIVGAIVFVALFAVLKAFYNGLRAPYEASYAARQVEDSAVVWNVTHNIIQNDAFIWIAGAVTLVVVLLCLAPAIKDAINN